MFIVKELFSVDAGALSDNPIPTDIYTSNEANKKGNYFLLHLLCFVKAYLMENHRKTCVSHSHIFRW